MWKTFCSRACAAWGRRALKPQHRNNKTYLATDRNLPHQVRQVAFAIAKHRQLGFEQENVSNGEILKSAELTSELLHLAAPQLHLSFVMAPHRILA